VKDRLFDVLVIYSAIINSNFNRYVSTVTTIWITCPSNDDTIAVAAAAAAAVATGNATVVVVQYVTEKLRVAVPTVHAVMPGTHVRRSCTLAVVWPLYNPQMVVAVVVVVVRAMQ
jgi:hypothetical protein